MAAVAGKIVPCSERRVSHREQVNQKAVRLDAGDGRGISCTVIDISDAGARIRIDNGNDLNSGRLKLFIEDRHQIIECEQVWRKGDEVGLRIHSVASMSQ